MRKMNRKDRTANLWDYVTEKLGQEPAQIDKLRSEGEDRTWHRVHWGEGKPSIVIVVTWDEFVPKWLKEAQIPTKGGVILRGLE